MEAKSSAERYCLTGQDFALGAMFLGNSPRRQIYSEIPGTAINSCRALEKRARPPNINAEIVIQQKAMKRHTCINKLLVWKIPN